MYAYADVQHVHLEITSRCNAACPQCPRNLSGGAPNPNLPLTELSLDDAKAIFPVELVKRLRSLYLCGNYGDPLVATSTLEVLAWLKSVNPRIGLGVHTNGSGRDAAWWRELAGLVTYCRFGIDGLEDTNHLYRRGTSWDRIVDAVNAFVAAGGGRAEWDFILFEHNQHQVDEAVALARSLGFKKFYVKRTGRFFDARTGKNAPRREVYDRHGASLYSISPPQDPDWQNPAAQALSTDAGDPAAYKRYLETAPIRCKVTDPPKIYVSAEGLVLPCCFLANLYPPNRPLGAAPAWRLIDSMGGKTAIDARVTPIAQIIDGPLFQKMVPGGWESGPLDQVRLEPCARVCGSHDLHSAQYAPSLI